MRTLASYHCEVTMRKLPNAEPFPEPTLVLSILALEGCEETFIANIPHRDLSETQVLTFLNRKKDKALHEVINVLL